MCLADEWGLGIFSSRFDGVLLIPVSRYRDVATPLERTL
jgi:hypothetical protein